MLKVVKEISSAKLEKISKKIKKGEIVCFPTDTVYGIGAFIENENSLKMLYDIKNRPYNSPIIVLLSNKDMLYKYTDNISEKTKKLINKFWPGALSIIVNKNKNIPDIISSKEKTIGFRIPLNKIAIDLIEFVGGGLATTSANKSGEISPVLAEQVFESFKNDNRVKYLIDGGATKERVESTVIDMTKEKPLIIREGIISKKEIEEVIGKVEVIKEERKTKKININIKFFNKKEDIKFNQENAYITMRKYEEFKHNKNYFYFSENGDEKDILKNLFLILDKVIKLKYNIIYVEKTNCENNSYELIYKKINKYID
ncbi:tRNA threonylcarbamoyl adenosine modification protein (Sua5/YciO/YrdC/YwlC family) [Hypnocyclicus thermotrophus]|uniref:Threonylcarbamoyl-AMP synthase n=1 Tax=Hypnocyclicus thermotrophus TaxID=1627895 RepID=A0AA46DXC0_9FUSO|nr:L-threonylcarbamoyladenylate synthase [Hypnocyclicus thermotrophus]TDT68006.1 tRNA threonylcarbamoyl adenosine modification protein (Sua5/YciO/YrdC/YwlC family) [Hypnocyclicus thermotrophus]